MRPSAALVDDLAVVSASFDDPTLDLPTLLSLLLQNLGVAVPSVVGFEIVTNVHDQWLSLVVSNDPAGQQIDANASLFLPVLPSGPAGGGGLIVYAAACGAFIDLAEDARSVLGPPGRVTMDAHLLPTPAHPEGLGGLDDFDAINQALGALVAAGHAEPHRELARRGTDARQSLSWAAREFLAESTGYSMAESG